MEGIRRLVLEQASQQEIDRQVVELLTEIEAEAEAEGIIGQIIPATGKHNDPFEVFPIIEANNLVTSNFDEHVTDTVAEMWHGLMNPTIGNTTVARWHSTIGPLMNAAQQEAASQTQAFHQQVLTRAGKRNIEAALDREDIIDLLRRRGTTLGQVYHRPVATARSVLAAGGSHVQAVARGEARARSLVKTDLQLARTKTSKEVLSGTEGVNGYRRVLTGAESCGLCMHASTRRYKIGDLLPIHPGCDCGVLPIVGDFDPGEVWNRSQLEDLKRQGVEPIETTVYEHGDIGPTLAVKGQHQLRDSKASSRPDANPEPVPSDRLVD